MKPLLIREIDKDDRRELGIVTEHCMKAVLETIPKFQKSEEKARQSLPNFSAGEMSRMIASDFHDPAKRIVVATLGEALVGQALYSIKTDGEGERYGFCFSRYVVPAHRRKGVGSALMEDALIWFAAEGARYVCAQTHVSNVALQRLFAKFGFRMDGPFSGAWEYLVLRKELS